MVFYNRDANFYRKGNIFFASCSKRKFESQMTSEKKRARNSNFVNDKHLYSQSNGHNLKKKKEKSLLPFDFVESSQKPCAKIYVLIRN